MTKDHYSFNSSANAPYNGPETPIHLSGFRRRTFLQSPASASLQSRRSLARNSPYQRPSPRPVPAPRARPSLTLRSGSKRVPSTFRGPTFFRSSSMPAHYRNSPMYHYSELLKMTYDEIHGDVVKTYGRMNLNPEDNVKEPRGVAYDEELKHFVVADAGNNAIRFYSETSETGDCVTANLKRPTALATCQPGRGLAILDREGIRLYDYRNREFLTIVKIEDCRGLGCTIRGDLVTMQRVQGVGEPPQFFVRIFSSAKHDTLLYSCPYLPLPIPKTKPSTVREHAPNFVDVSNDRVCVTDASASSFVIYELDPYRPQLLPIEQKQAHGRYEGHFEYISAVKLDASGELLIADSRRSGKQQGRLQYFDSRGIFKKMVNFDDDFACVSGMAVNREKQLMVSHYHPKDSQSCVKLYQLRTGKGETSKFSSFTASSSGFSTNSIASTSRRSLLPTPTPLSFLSEAGSSVRYYASPQY